MMGGSFKIGRAFGIDVKVHWSFFLLLAFFGFLAFRDSGSLLSALVTVGLVVALFFCVLLHEFGHSLVAIRLGSEVQDITLLPIGGLARMKSLPERPIDEVKVAVAGPLVNVVLAPIFFGLALLFGGSLSVPTNILSGADSLGQVFAALGAINVALVVFNMIPAFPMDGGRVLRALIAMRRSHAEATRIAGRIGQVAAFLFAIIGLFTNPMLIVIGLFVYLAATAETQHVAFRDGTKGLPVREAMMSKVETLSPTATLDDAINCLIRTSQKEFPVVDGFGRPRGLVTRDVLIPALRDGGPQSLVLDILIHDIPAVRSREPLETALAALNRARAPAPTSWPGKSPSSGAASPWRRLSPSSTGPRPRPSSSSATMSAWKGF